MLDYRRHPWLSTLAMVGVTSACGPRLARRALKHHPEINLQVDMPTVLKASAPQRPRWLGRAESSPAGVAFVGHGSGDTVEAAKEGAARDLFRTVGNFVAVDVQSEFESIQEHRRKGGEVEGSQSVHSETHTQASQGLLEIQPADSYWEKVAVPEHGITFRYSILAVIPRAELERGAVLTSRHEGALVVLLPFRPSAGPEGAALEYELRTHLVDLPKMVICPPAILSPLLEATPGDWLAAVAELAPDLVVQPAYHATGEHLEAIYSIHRGVTPTPLLTRRLSQPTGDFFGLQDLLSRSLRADLETFLEKPRARL